MKIAMLLSGGVDSSVALHLAHKKKNADVHAYYLKIWLEDEVSYLGDCPWEEDLRFAREVCDGIGVPLTVVPLQREYFDRVVQYALSELKQGRTPSPDIFCNRRIKFGAFRDVVANDCEVIASGHYAQIEAHGGVRYLRRAPDPVKDQTYFLSHMTQQQLKAALFPIGALTKVHVRSLADEFDLPNKDRKDSQGICFLGKIRYPDFVRHYLGEAPGEIREQGSERVLGEHKGFWFHTIGQRQGLGLGNGPWYVSGKDVDENVVYVTHGTAATTRERFSFHACEAHWISGPPGSYELSAKLRHGPEMVRCSISPPVGGRFEVTLAEGDAGIAPGQFCVLYDDDICLGGARIEG